jgi:hypothetical protein
MDYYKKYIKYKLKYDRLKKELIQQGNGEVKINKTEVLSKLNELVKDDKRIINLKTISHLTELPELPQWFDQIIEKKMMLAAGDGYHPNGLPYDIDGFNRDKRMPSDIEFMTKILNYNIFCCCPSYNPMSLLKNVEYMKENPDLKILLILCDLNDESHNEILGQMFENKINIINTHDIRIYINGKIAHKILVSGGVCIGPSVGTRNRIGSLSFKWVTPGENMYFKEPYFNCENRICRKLNLN